MVSFSVASDVRQRFPEAHVAFVQGQCRLNAFSHETAYSEYAFRAESNAREIPILAEHPHIASWRKMFRGFGEDPTKRKPSAEALAKRVRRGESLPRINAVVDCYNAVSLNHLIPVGGQDASRLSGNVRLRFAKEGEPFTALGGEHQTVHGGEVVYADDKTVLCRKWNYRDCEPAKISNRTNSFVLFVDGGEGISRDRVEAAATDLCDLINTSVSEGCATYSLIPFSGA
ncbi:hypothetical protein KJ765_02080 [Candidatus Micrarchaeota archaeon]|nr:hypothetical protein [Candidatus Micrarchaeota archaeon]